MNSHDCKTKDDILLYMISNFRFVPGNVLVGEYRQVLGFRQNMQISQVWFNKNTNKWAFHVSDDEFTGTPNMGEYDTFADLMHGVSTIYAKRWPIRDEPSTIDITSYTDSITIYIEGYAY
jgi:hypothetical protein